MDSPTSANPLGAKPKKWAHGGEVPVTTLSNGQIAEVGVGLQYQWDPYRGDFIKASIWQPYFADAITTVTTIVNAAAVFGGCILTNLNSSPAWLQVFDTQGSVTLGSTTPTFVIGIPCNATATNGVGIVASIPVGVSMQFAIKVAATTTPKGASTVSTGLSGLIYIAT